MPLDLNRNMLGDEISPYLLQHRDNPVHWQAWSPQLLERAQALGKPILLSSGYAACHWCHVMAHESFEDPATAQVMNELFINVKIDREERPDLDYIYQRALALLGQQGGWPLTMFLTPKGEPFWGGTYFPPEARYGRPAFRDILRRVAELWRDDPAAIEQNRAALMAALARDAAVDAAQTQQLTVSPALLDQIAARLMEYVDFTDGGIQGAPKFPHMPIFELIWRNYLRRGDGALRARDAAQITLRQMSEGGIYDHLGGGYARYSVDERWLVPHFEKMLYDNAQILDLLSLVWTRTRDPLLLQRAEETFAWADRDMTTDRHAFAATLDADSDGEEGKFYVWDPQEIEDILGRDAAQFCAAYDVTEEGNWEGKNILNRLHHPGWQGDATEAELANLRAPLLAVRSKRIAPGRDDKILADWNGLMIAALARAGARFDRPDWLTRARLAFEGVVHHLADGDRLWHAARAGARRGQGLLEDYAFMADAALALFEATQDRAYLDHAQRWADAMHRHFWDRVEGGFFMTPDDGEAVIVRKRVIEDQAIPAGNGVALRLLSRLARATGADRYRQWADAMEIAFLPMLGRNLFGMGTFLNALEDHRLALDVVIIAPPDDPARAALLRAAWAAGDPRAMILCLTEDEAARLGTDHPAHGKTLQNGQASAYVCRMQTCAPPVTDGAALTDLLQRTGP